MYRRSAKPLPSTRGPITPKMRWTPIIIASSLAVVEVCLSYYYDMVWMIPFILLGMWFQTRAIMRLHVQRIKRMGRLRIKRQRSMKRCPVGGCMYAREFLGGSEDGWCCCMKYL